MISTKLLTINQNNSIGRRSTGEACPTPVKNDSFPRDYISPSSKYHQGNVPSCFARVRSEEDVSAMLREAKQANKKVVIKNVDHDWKGGSAGKGAIAIWTHTLRYNGSELGRKPISVDRALVLASFPA